MKNEEFRALIDRGDTEGVRRALESDAGLAKRTIRWHLNRDNESDPLHYVSDAVGHGWLADDKAAEMARLLLAHGAPVDGSRRRETPLIGAASLGAEAVAAVLIEAGADLEARAIFGARALHWAAWMGARPTVERLIARGAEIDPKCVKFGATPLFWAVHGYGPDGPATKTGQVDAARLLIEAGARVDTSNNEGVSALEMAEGCERSDMHELLRHALSATSR